MRKIMRGLFHANFAPIGHVGDSLFTSSLAVPRKYEYHLWSPTGMRSAAQDGYKSRKASALGSSQNTKQSESCSENKPSG